MLLEALNKKDNQILQQNEMLLGSQSINLRARQMVYLLSMLLDKSEPHKEIRISVSDFTDFMNQMGKETWSDIYAQTSDIFDHLNDNPILIKSKKKKDYIKINWLSKLGVIDGEIIARFTGEIAEYMVYKQGLPYTKVLWDLRPYNSNFTARIMDIFQRYHKKDEASDVFYFEYGYEDLRFFFAVGDKYPRFCDFKRRILETAQKELAANEAVPYWFEYEVLRKNRKVVGIRFKVHIRRNILDELLPSNRTRIKGLTTNHDTRGTGQAYDALIGLGMSEKAAKKAVSTMSYTQRRALYALVDYGVNPKLAEDIVRTDCSFGELKDSEDGYVTYVLNKIERERKARIEAAKAGKATKKTTSKEFRGGLPKKVFKERRYFSEYMEILSKERKASYEPSSRTESGFSSMNSVLERFKNE